MISCKRATELLSQQMEEKLSLKEEFALKLHLFICEFCEQFKKQSLHLRSVFKEQSTVDKIILENKRSETPIPAGLKEKIKRRLKLTL